MQWTSLSFRRKGDLLKVFYGGTAPLASFQVRMQTQPSVPPWLTTSPPQSQFTVSDKHGFVIQVLAFGGGVIQFLKFHSVIRGASTVQSAMVDASLGRVPPGPAVLLTMLKIRATANSVICLSTISFTSTSGANFTGANVCQQKPHS